MPHLRLWEAPGADAAMSARISRNFARASFGAALMYCAIVVGFTIRVRDQARPAFESVGVWKYSLSDASCSIRRFSSDIRPSAVLIGMQSWQRVSPQGWRE